MRTRGNVVGKKSLIGVVPYGRDSVFWWEVPAYKLISMALDKQKVLLDAPAALNYDDQPWTVTVAGDSIIASWKWMDARFFGPESVTDEERNYTFVATLKNNGKWKETGSSSEKSSNVSLNGGTLSFGSSSSSFKGKSSEISVSFGFGQNKDEGNVGMVKSTLDTELIKNAVRGYLEYCGWKKAGLFG